MPEEKEPPRPHGDKLAGAARLQPDNPEDNQAQIQSDAPDSTSVREESDRNRGSGSTANGVPAFDEDAGENRKRLYRKGADLVSRID